jgi:hypothetical protein
MPESITIRYAGLWRKLKVLLGTSEERCQTIEMSVANVQKGM